MPTPHQAQNEVEAGNYWQSFLDGVSAQAQAGREKEKGLEL